MKTCFFLHQDGEDVSKVKLFLMSVPVEIIECLAASEFYEKITRKYSFSLIVGESVPDSPSMTNFTNANSLLFLSTQYGIPCLVINNKNNDHDSEKISEFLKRNNIN